MAKRHPDLECPGQEGVTTRGLRPFAWLMLALLVLLRLPAYAQEAGPVKTATPVSDKDELQVNWLYGSFVPKEVPFIPLTPQQRWKLYVRATYTTWGIYVKTVFFTATDQINNSPTEWGRTWEGFGKRLGTRQAQFVIQNSLNHMGNAAVGWEPRYDRCRCAGFWPRTKHAVVRNFVTYGGPNQRLRPQLMPYVAAFGGRGDCSNLDTGNQCGGERLPRRDHASVCGSRRQLAGRIRAGHQARLCILKKSICNAVNPREWTYPA